MTALSTAEAALRRAPDDPAVPITVSGEEAVAVIAELDRLRERGDELARVASEHYSFTSTDAHRNLLRARLIAKVRAWTEAR